MLGLSVFQPLYCSETFRKCLRCSWNPIQVSILLSVINQMGRNVTSAFYFYVATEYPAVARGNQRLRGTLLEKHFKWNCW